MRRTEIIARKREGSGKGVARKARANGRIPGVMYGLGGEPVSVDVDAKSFTDILRHGDHQLVSVRLEADGEALTIIKALDRDPLTEVVLHVDFLRVDMNQAIHTQVAIHLEGAAPGVKEGGIVEHITREVEVIAKPGDIPERLVLDISALQIGDSLHVSDLAAPEGVEILTDPERPIVSVISPAKLAAAMAEAASAEPGADEGAEGGTKEESEED